MDRNTIWTYYLNGMYTLEEYFQAIRGIYADRTEYQNGEYDEIAGYEIDWSEVCES